MASPLPARLNLGCCKVNQSAWTDRSLRVMRTLLALPRDASAEDCLSSTVRGWNLTASPEAALDRRSSLPWCWTCRPLVLTEEQQVTDRRHRGHTWGLNMRTEAQSGRWQKDSHVFQVVHFGTIPKFWRSPSRSVPYLHFSRPSSPRVWT